MKNNRTFKTLLNRTLVLGLVTMLLSAVGSFAADEDSGARWDAIGSKRLTKKQDSQTIHARTTLGEISELQLSVQNVAVQFTSIEVHDTFGNVEKIDFDDRVRAGDLADIALEESTRIDKIVLSYDPESLGGRAALVKIRGR